MSVFRICLVTVVLSVWTGLATAQAVDTIANVEFRIDERVFAVMCALHTAGYDQALPNEPGASIRSQLLADLNARQLDPGLAAELSGFFKRANVELDTAKQPPKYLAFALLLGPPPNFEYQHHLGEATPPPSVQTLMGFESLLARYYTAVAGRQLWQKWQPAVTADLIRLKSDFKDTIQAVLQYNRISAQLYLNRRLVVVADPMDAPNLVNAILLEGNYFIVASPPSGAGRYTKFFIHEYLHFLLDPVLDPFDAKFDGDAELKSFTAEHKEYSGVGSLSRLVRESLINAAELAILQSAATTSSKTREEMIRRDSPFLSFFDTALADYQKSPKPLADFTVELLGKTKAVALVASYRPPVATAQVTPAPAVASVRRSSSRPKLLLEAEGLIHQGKVAEAEAMLAKVLATNPTDPVALFSLGQCRYAAEDFTGALSYYDQALALPGTPAWVRGWSLVRGGNCLVRLEKKVEAVKRFRQALNASGDDQGAADAARRALERLESPEK